MWQGGGMCRQRGCMHTHACSPGFVPQGYPNNALVWIARACVVCVCVWAGSFASARRWGLGWLLCHCQTLMACRIFAYTKSIVTNSWRNHTCPVLSCAVPWFAVPARERQERGGGGDMAGTWQDDTGCGWVDSIWVRTLPLRHCKASCN